MESRLLVLPNSQLMVLLSYWESRGDELLLSCLRSHHQHPILYSLVSLLSLQMNHPRLYSRVHQTPSPLTCTEPLLQQFLSLSHYRLVLLWLDHSNQHADVATNYFTFGKLNRTAQYAGYFHKCYSLSFLQLCVVESISLVWWHKGVRYIEVIKNEAWI